MHALGLLALTVCSLWLTAGAAHAQSVALDLTACREPPAREVRTIAALELRGRLVERAAAQASLRIAVVCEDEHAELCVYDADPADEAESTRAAAAAHAPRLVDLGTVPAPLRARLLALAIAEVARGESGLQATTRTSEVPTAPAPQPVEVATPRLARGVSADVWRGWIAAGPGLQLAPLTSGALSLSSLLALAGPLSWSAALSVAQARRDIEGGRLRVRQLSARSGPALHWARARWLMHAGVAARLTVLGMVGEPSDRAQTQSGRFSTFVVGPELFAGAALALGWHAVVALEAELAHQLREVRAIVQDGSRETLSPWRTSLSVLVGARW